MKVVDPCQSAFVVRRLITDKFMVAFYIQRRKRGSEGMNGEA